MAWGRGRAGRHSDKVPARSPRDVSPRHQSYTHRRLLDIYHELRCRYRDWPWFNTLIDLLEMILAKSEAHIAENYDNQLVHDVESQMLGKELREKLKQTRATIVAITGNIIPFLLMSRRCKTDSYLFLLPQATRRYKLTTRS